MFASTAKALAISRLDPTNGGGGPRRLTLFFSKNAISISVIYTIPLIVNYTRSMSKLNLDPKEEKPLVYTVLEAAEKLRMSANSLTKEIQRGRIGCIAASKNVRRIPAVEIERYLQAEPARYRARKARLATNVLESANTPATRSDSTGRVN